LLASVIEQGYDSIGRSYLSTAAQVKLKGYDVMDALS
jgi:hypothetical protein